MQTDQRHRFDRLWRRARPRLWRLAARLAGDPDRADDLLQEACLRAWQSFASFRHEASAYTWLYRITLNVAAQDRARRTLDAVSLDAPGAFVLTADPTHSPESLAVEADLIPRIWAALNRLPEDQRTTLILHVYESLKYREIADLLHIPLGTVMSRLHTARRRLQEELHDDL